MEIKEFIEKIDINKLDKEKILKLTPRNYIGLSEFIVENNK